METISITKYIAMLRENGLAVDRLSMKKRFEAALSKKSTGATCCICESPIWAAGSAVTGENLCFTCITGEMDDSDDFEVIADDSCLAVESCDVDAYELTCFVD